MNINENSGKLYDLTSVFAICENNPGFLAKLILVFSDNISNDILLIKEAAKVANWQQVAQLVHKMKPSLAHFGAASVKGVVLELEHPTSGDTRYLNSLVTELDRVVNEILESLKNEFPEIFKQ